MQEKLAEVKHSFQVCKEADDYLTARKLFFVQSGPFEAQLRKEWDDHARKCRR